MPFSYQVSDGYLKTGCFGLALSSFFSAVLGFGCATLEQIPHHFGLVNHG